MKEAFFTLLEFIFILIIIYSLYVLLIFSPKFFDEPHLLTGIQMLLKMGSLFVGSSVLVYVTGSYKRSEIEKKSKINITKKAN